MKQLMKYNTTQDRLFITLSLLIIFGLILGDVPSWDPSGWRTRR